MNITDSAQVKPPFSRRSKKALNTTQKLDILITLLSGRCDGSTSTASSTEQKDSEKLDRIFRLVQKIL